MIHLSKVFSQFCIVLMKRQFVVSHTIRQTGIPALLDSSVTNTHVKILCTQNLHFVKKNRLNIFFISCKTVYLWVTTNRCFTGDVVMIIMFIYCRYIYVVANILTVHRVIKIIL